MSKNRVTLERVKRSPEMRQRLADRLVRIYSGQWSAWWRENACGYTDDVLQAGVYTFSDALAVSDHCGREKRIVYEFMPKAEREEIVKFWSPLRGDDGLPIFPSCETCVNFGSNDDGNYPEFAVSWPCCDRFSGYENLKSFPFKCPMPCFKPSYWATGFACLITNREVNATNRHGFCGTVRAFWAFLRSHGLWKGCST
ncbi:MAG: hypothetical protein AB7E47_02185 [Desulfovibrionaceae bacterium]